MSSSRLSPLFALGASLAYMIRADGETMTEERAKFLTVFGKQVTSGQMTAEQLQALTAAHAIPVNTLGAPFTVTTGRRLREQGWPEGVDTAVVMLDGECSFRTLAADHYDIWWGAYLGMAEERLVSGPLAEVAGEIVETRAKARAEHGWIMDIYLLRRR